MDIPNWCTLVRLKGIWYKFSAFV